MNKKIGVFDSGLGGLSILKELVKVIYLMKIICFMVIGINNPYGEKNESELLFYYFKDSRTFIRKWLQDYYNSL